MSGIKKKKHANPSENKFNTVGVEIWDSGSCEYQYARFEVLWWSLLCGL